MPAFPQFPRTDEDENRAPDRGRIIERIIHGRLVPFGRPSPTDRSAD